MSILSRFTQIIASNVNALLDKAEDPVKMCDQYIAESQKDLEEVKQETAEVMAEQKRCQRMIDENDAEIQKYLGLAKKALEAGNEGDAKIFVEKKQEIEANGASLKIAYEAAVANATKMRQLYDKLNADIKPLKARRDAVDVKMSVAKTQEIVNKYSAAADRIEGNLGAFARMEEKADKMLDIADAMAELQEETANDADAELLATKYDKPTSQAVDDELAALKAELGL